MFTVQLLELCGWKSEAKMTTMTNATFNSAPGLNLGLRPKKGGISLAYTVFDVILSYIYIHFNIYPVAERVFYLG